MRIQLAFDDLWFAAVLVLAAAAAWIVAAGARPLVRDNLRFAAALYAALAIGAALRIAPVAVAPIVTTLAAALLAFAVYASFRRPAKPAFAALVLAVCCIAGIASAYSGEAAFAIVPQLLCIFAMLGIARRGLMRLRAPSIQLACGGAALFAASCSLVSRDNNALMALLLFSAAGLLGVSLSVARISDTFVKRRRRSQSAAAVSNLR